MTKDDVNKTTMRRARDHLLLKSRPSKFFALQADTQIGSILITYDLVNTLYNNNINDHLSA